MTNSNLNITVEQIRGRVPVTVFHLEGKLDPTTTQALEQSAQEALEQGTRYLLLDFKGITLVTSAAFSETNHSQEPG